jgi:hypothetical protein
MTLVLTDICRLGISMAADSAVTRTILYPNREPITRVLTGVKKLQFVPKIKAGISCWGLGKINNIPLDIWLEELIRERTAEYNSLKSFAILLQNEVREVIEPLNEPMNTRGTIGFHLAGLEDYNGVLTPHFYHVRNGDNQLIRQRGIEFDPSVVNAHHEFTPEMFGLLSRGQVCRKHDGADTMYLDLFSRLNELFNHYASENQIRIPFVSHISGICKWSRFYIKLVSDLFQFSNMENVIGGQISTLWISLDGTHHLSTI